jgi:hypothetical protein
VAAGIAAPSPFGTSLLLSHVLEAVSIGLAVGASLIRPHEPGVAPLQDLPISSSADRAPFPFGYDTMRFGAQIIWSAGVTYVKKQTSAPKAGPR